MNEISDDSIDERLAAADPARTHHASAMSNDNLPAHRTSPVRAWWLATTSRSRRSLGAAVAGVAAVGVVLAGTFTAPNQPLIMLANNSATPSTQATVRGYGEMDASMKMMPAMNFSFVAGDNLPNDSGRGHVYRLELTDNLESVARTAADHFGVSGDYAKVSYFDSTWPTYVIGPEDGTAPSVMMTEYGQGSWYYSNPAAYPELRCLEENTVGKGRDAYTECTKYEEAETGGNPDETETRALAAAFFDAMGVAYELNDIVVHVDEWSSIASVSLKVDGFATAIETSISWAGNGEVSWATGNAVSPIDMGEFSTVSAVDAVARLDDWRWYGVPPTDYSGQQVAPMARGGVDDLAVSSDSASETESSEGSEPAPVATEEPTEPTSEPAPVATKEPTEPTTEPSPITPTLPEEPPMEERIIVIDSAEDAMLLVWDQSGAAWLVPGMYLNGADWWPQTVISLVDGVIQLPDPVEVMPLD